MGVELGEVGRDAHGGVKSNYRPAEEIRARVTILADGSHGVLSTQFRERFGAGGNPQVYSLGIKAVVQFAGDNPFGNNRVLHTLGYPNPASVFGGGFIYSMGEKTAAVGLIMGLDWKYGDLNAPARVRALSCPPVHRKPPEGLGHDRDRRQDDPRGRLPRARSRWRCRAASSSATAPAS